MATTTLGQRAVAAKKSLVRLLDCLALANRISEELKTLRAASDPLEREIIANLVGTENPLGKQAADGSRAKHSFSSAKEALCDDPTWREHQAALEQKTLEWGNVQRAITGAKAQYQLDLSIFTVGTELEPLEDEVGEGLEMVGAEVTL